ncbi:hypothetical protein PMAYCL1PPCAC_12627, partial [Pristionchus mayeri]
FRLPIPSPSLLKSPLSSSFQVPSTIRSGDSLPSSRQSPLKRLAEAQSLLNELLELDESLIAHCPQIEDFADDILKKLSHIRVSISSSLHSPSLSYSSSSCPSPTFDSSSRSDRSDGMKNEGRSLSIPRSDRLHYSSLLSPRHNLSPPPSSACSTSSDFSYWSSSDGMPPSFAAAQLAFDTQIYSRCVQIVERMAKGEERNLERGLLLLAHRSYSHMVEDSENDADAAKMAQYWVAFIDRSLDPQSLPLQRLELLDYRCEAVEALNGFSRERDEELAVKRITSTLDCYKVSLLVFRPFDLNSLRRLLRLAIVLNDTHIAKGALLCVSHKSLISIPETAEYLEADEVYCSAVRKSWRDRAKYEEETKTSTRIKTDTDAVVATEMMGEIQQLRPIVSVSRSASNESDDIVQKIFIEDLVIRL